MRYLLCLCSCLLLAGCGGMVPPTNSSNDSNNTNDISRQVALPDNRWSALPANLTIPAMPQGVYRGFNLSHSHRTKGYGSDASQTSKEKLKTLGVNWISVTRFGWMEGSKASEVRYDRYRPFETEANLLTQEVEQARKLNMKVMLKPHVWVGGGGWIGDLRPSDENGGWDAFFQSYKTFILKYAELGQKLNVELFCIGVELKSATGRFKEKWTDIIDAVRQVYKGKLVYASNWDETPNVVFWDKVDALGVDFYGPLTNEYEPSMQTLVNGVKKYLDSYVGIANRHNIPVIFTEVGYRSTVASFRQPHIWPEQLPEDQRKVDVLSQAVGYAAFLTAVSQYKEVQGIFWWKWFTDMQTDEEGEIGFSPFGKLASKVLTASFGPVEAAIPASN